MHNTFRLCSFHLSREGFPCESTKLILVISNLNVLIDISAIRRNSMEWNGLVNKQADTRRTSTPCAACSGWLWAVPYLQHLTCLCTDCSFALSTTQCYRIELLGSSRDVRTHTLVWAAKIVCAFISRSSWELYIAFSSHAMRRLIALGFRPRPK
ncbi:hypothetical protein BJ165DRAFT_893617 [Panaeolus papilionaceus]|nr:hypothetical protein BJ165DRAFT_893617 [Panaeolus papilionaceus]